MTAHLSVILEMLEWTMATTDLVRFIFVCRHQFDHGERTPKNMCFGVEVLVQ